MSMMGDILILSVHALLMSTLGLCEQVCGVLGQNWK